MTCRAKEGVCETGEEGECAGKQGASLDKADELEGSEQLEIGWKRQFGGKRESGNGWGSEGY